MIEVIGQALYGLNGLFCFAITVALGVVVTLMVPPPVDDDEDNT